MRSHRVAAAIRVSSLSTAWGFITGFAAVMSGVAAGSVVLIGLGLNSLIDGAASAVLIWRFRVERTNSERSQRVEHAARQLVAVALLIVAAYLTFRALLSLATQTGPTDTEIGLSLAVASLVVLPAFAVRKLRLATQLGSRALRSDGVLSAAGALLALAALLALVATMGFGWWWSDAVATAIIAGVLALEGVRSLLDSNGGGEERAARAHSD